MSKTILKKHFTTWNNRLLLTEEYKQQSRTVSQIKYIYTSVVTPAICKSEGISIPADKVSC